MQLPDYRAFPREAAQAPEVADEDVDRMLEEQRRMHATLAPAEVVGPDSVVEVSGSFIDEKGEPGTIEQTQIALDRAFPEFREALLGARAGEERQVPFDNQNLERTARVAVEDVRAVELPEADDAFAQECGHENLKEMRGALANAMRAELSRVAEQTRRAVLLDRIVKEADARVPETLVQRETHALMHEKHGEDAHDEEPDEETLKTARENARAKLVVERLIETEQIHVTQLEFEGARGALEENRGARRLGDQELRALYGILLDEKLHAFLGTLGEEPKGAPATGAEPEAGAE